MESDKRGIDYRFRDGILEVQQKVGYKNQILENKLALIQQDLETKETQLGEVLASANLDPLSLETVTRRMEVKIVMFVRIFRCDFTELMSATEHRTQIAHISTNLSRHKLTI